MSRHKRSHVLRNCPYERAKHLEWCSWMQARGVPKNLRDLSPCAAMRFTCAADDPLSFRMHMLRFHNGMNPQARKTTCLESIETLRSQPRPQLP